MKLILLHEDFSPYEKLYEVSLNPNIQGIIKLLQDMVKFTGVEYIPRWIHDFEKLWKKIISKLNSTDKATLFRYLSQKTSAISLPEEYLNSLGL